MQVRCFHVLEEVEVFRTEIDAINLRSNRPDPFSTFEFYENFLARSEFSTPKSRLWFLAAFIEERLVGYVALKLVTQKFFGIRSRRLDFLVAHDGDRPHVVAEDPLMPDVTAIFYAYLLGRKSDWEVLEFEQQDSRSILVPLPPQIKPRGLFVTQWPNMANCTIHVRWRSLGEYFRAMSKKFRSNVSRQMRSLFAAGQLELLSSSDPNVTPALFELYLDIDRRSWKSQANLSVTSGDSQIEYFKGLLKATQPMKISIQILLLDEIPIAGLINGAFGSDLRRGLYALQIAYDQNLSGLAPGSALLLMGMRQAIVGNVAFFNLLSGFGYYKTRWLADVTETRSVQIYRVGTLAYWRRILGNLTRRMRTKHTQDSEFLFNVARRDVDTAELRTGGENQIVKVSGKERQHLLQLVAKVKQSLGELEYLSCDELAAIMPFATRREDLQSQPKQAVKIHRRISDAA